MAKAMKISERPQPQYGSDVIVDMLKSFEIEYVALNPGSSFRGLHDSLVNYGGNQKPETILVCHEEIAVGVAIGYARAKGRPMAAAIHNVVGLQHATMAIYNAWCDRQPVIVLGGTGPVDSTNRRPGMDWTHTALVQGNLVRDFVKWDDQPGSVEAIAESFIRGYRLATTEPKGPVYLCYDVDVQEKKLDGQIFLPDLERYAPALPLQAPEEGFKKSLEWLTDAKAPAIIADTVGRHERGFRALQELAELLAAPVLDRGSRFNFPTNHPLNLSGLEEKVLSRCDLVLALDVADFHGAVSKRNQEMGQRIPTPLLSPGTKIINVGLEDLLVRSWSTDFFKLREADLSVLADTSVFLPELLRRLRDEKEFLKRKQSDIEARRRDWINLRREKEEALGKETRAKWEVEPVSTNRLFSELATVLKDDEWVLVNSTGAQKENLFLGPDKFNQVLGKNKGGGLGYGLPASVGAALALKDSGKICVDVQPDGDMLMTITALWTAAHHRIPLLVVVFNNRSYYNDEEHQERMAQLRGRPVENKTIGIRIEDPPFDFATMARACGHWSAGPISDPGEVGKTLRDALRVVKEEKRLALVDVVCQMR
ncbi:MAG TPA: thiamine pyrophosphate-binding protein [Candidatus Binatia bacterium]|jgi:thiamine pyrophosphate-dependent acetolactate synthase large subunit-like protein|nr:thiamine pyrophosphate-binding protein [Candidatus Binatia bacterium]